MIFHRRHLHSVRISGQPTLQHGAPIGIISQVNIFDKEIYNILEIKVCKTEGTTSKNTGIHKEYIGKNMSDWSKVSREDVIKAHGILYSL